MDVTKLIDYYENLLIIQYHNKPKAQATIELFVKELLANGILLDIQNAYDIFNPADFWDISNQTWDSGLTWDDTSGLAQGVQLDIIGKYVGVDRFYSELILENYFSFITYDEVNALPSSPPRFGFSDYDNFTAYSYNGTLVYSDIIAKGNVLTDDAYLTLIKLKIILNNCNFSQGEIDAALYNFFGTEIRAESIGDMHMVFFITTGISSLIQAIISKKLLPRPMGVGAAIVENISGQMFSFTDYDGAASPFGHGFCDYASFALLPGQVLQYSQIIGD